MPTALCTVSLFKKTPSTCELASQSDFVENQRAWLRPCHSLLPPHFTERETEAREEKRIPPFYTEVSGRLGREPRTADSWSNVCVHVCMHICTLRVHARACVCMSACTGIAVCILSLISHSVIKAFLSC